MSDNLRLNQNLAVSSYNVITVYSLFWRGKVGENIICFVYLSQYLNYYNGTIYFKSFEVEKFHSFRGLISNREIFQ